MGFLLTLKSLPLEMSSPKKVCWLSDNDFNSPVTGFRDPVFGRD
jgi:hypothetical protein